jgi:precorrin-2 dehydrogenase / sirohydrochlorin ferrochelatase
MGCYPIVLELEGRPCLVVGGGAVAERKVEALLAAEARVTVVSPTVTPPLAGWAHEGKIHLVARAWERGDLAGHALVFVATDDGAVTAEVASEGRRGGVWVNAADDPEHCDFILPSVLRRDTLTVAVSTGGTSPALARAIREELETYFTDDYRVLARLAGEARRELRESGATADADAWRRALDPALRRLIAEGREGEARARLLGRLRAGACA